MFRKSHPKARALRDGRRRFLLQLRRRVRERPLQRLDDLVFRRILRLRQLVLPRVDFLAARRFLHVQIPERDVTEHVGERPHLRCRPEVVLVGGKLLRHKEVVTIDCDKRPYYLFVPDSLDARPVPLLIVLHGSGRDGKSLVDPWRDLASREGFIVAGPDAADRRAWIAPDDGPAFLYWPKR